MEVNNNTRVAPKLMPPILLCWSTTSEADVGGMAVEVEPCRQYPISFVAVRQMAAGGSLTRWRTATKRMEYWRGGFISSLTPTTPSYVVGPHNKIRGIFFGADLLIIIKAR